MVRAAALVGEAVRRVHRTHGEAMKQQDVSFDVSIMLGGQIAGRTLRLFHIYAAGNFIEATADTPYLQIGEHKYGKPMLDRAITRDTSLVEGVKLAQQEAARIIRRAVPGAEAVAEAVERNASRAHRQGLLVAVVVVAVVFFPGKRCL